METQGLIAMTGPQKAQIIVGLLIVALGVCILVRGYIKSNPLGAPLNIPLACTGCSMKLRLDEIAYMAGPPSGPDTVYCIACAQHHKKDLRSRFASEDAYNAFMERRHRRA